MFLHEEVDNQRSEVLEMLISEVELPVSDPVQAARFYGDVLGLPTRTRDGVVEVEVGRQCCCSMSSL
jgi:predicted enzyme related to lactoylglutathione lyase